jgi:hypothetical protein
VGLKPYWRSGCTVVIGRPVYRLPRIPGILQINSIAPSLKLQNTTFLKLKNLQLGMVVDHLKLNKFIFWPNFQIPLDFEL